MKTFAVASALAAITVVSGSPTGTQTLKEPPTKRGSLPAVSVSGNAFYADGKRFYIRGIDYQPGGSSANKDPLADPDTCNRDIPYFKKLGVNTVRVYSIDNSQNHDTCMSALEDAGIYLVADVNSGDYSINRDDPKTSYNAAYLQSVFATISSLANYTNTMAFFSGNEVINDKPNSVKTAPYVKAVQRDMKNYMNAQGLRHVPVGYSAADVDTNRQQTADFMNCGDDAERGDFFAFNDYSWCNSNFQTSGWDQKVKNFTGYGIPIFLSEYGCTKNRPRTFGEVGALMSSEMDAVYSGGIMYEYANDPANDYGIVSISGSSVKELDEFANFQSALSKYPTPTGSGNAASTSNAVSCPASVAGWEVNPTELPEMPSQAQKYMKDGAGKGPGLGGSGSQQDSDSGTATAMVTGATASPTAAGGSGGSSGNSSDDSAGMPTFGSMDKSALLVSGATIFFSLCGALLL